MASRVQQDAFIDDDDESCPLCVEELDLSDKNFRPCPCGYQVCQFCYNNIKNQMNGLCPACRRPYDDESIEWKIVSPEEQKADIALQAKKKAQARKQESEQRQVETTNRKNLAGIRVVQKNLVYVVGLSQKSSEEEFLRTLRGPQYFGQYGKITKIVVSKAKEGQNNNNSIGVYVTFESKEDASRCIAAVDGSQNLDRPLRAQYGTTKYCSAFLRNEVCGNRNCTFLHETGEENDSFSRQDLSSMNALSTQRPAQHSSASRPIQQPQPPLQQNVQNISAAPHPGPIQPTRAESMSRSDSGDGPGLPSSATWAAKNMHNESRMSSQPTSAAAPSPVITSSSVPSQVSDSRATHESEIEEDFQIILARYDSTPLNIPVPPHPLERFLKKAMPDGTRYIFNRASVSKEELHRIDTMPLLIDPNGGLIRLRMERADERKRQKLEEERNSLGAIATVEEDEAPASGSLQLGGEPETKEEPKDNSNRMSALHRGTIQPPFGSSSNFTFNGPSFQTQNNNSSNRAISPQQQHHISFPNSHSNRQSPVSASHFQNGYSGNTSFHRHQQSNPFQMQNQTFSTAQGHTRQASRFDFANDSNSSSTAVKPVANPQLMAQQSSMMPANQNKHFQNQGLQQQGALNNHFYSGVHGPPPGLKSSGTPPISGGGMFGQGYGFTSAMGGVAGFGTNATSKNSNDELMRDLMRNRNGSVNGQGPDTGKPSPSQPPPIDTTIPQDTSLDPTPVAPPKATVSSKPAVIAPPALTSSPPGLSLRHDFPPLAAPSAPPIVPTAIQKNFTTRSIKPVVPVIPTSSSRVTEVSTKPQSVKQAATDAKSPTKILIEPGQSTEDLSLKESASKGTHVSISNAPSEFTSQSKEDVPNVIDKATDKKQRPSKLNIIAATEASGAIAVDVKSTVAETPSALDLSQPPTPATAASRTSVTSSVRSRPPRTLRLSREDVPLNSPSVPLSAAPSRQNSRRASLTSAIRPDTPSSEKISDNASFTTTSISRANSPPSFKVGSAPVRVVTKNQQKKERQARAKLAESTARLEEVPTKAEEIQAPILGRKKKTKKEKTQGTAESTPTVTRPTSPLPREGTEEEIVVTVPKKSGSKSVPEAKDPETPSSPATPAGGDQQKAAMTVAAIWASLQRAGDLGASAADAFKAVPGINHRFEPIPHDFVNIDDLLSEDQLSLSHSGELVDIDNGPNDHIIVFQDGRMLRGFSAEGAARYLELRTKPLWNGEIPSHRALDHLIPFPPDFETNQPSKGANNKRKLGNPFLPSRAGSDPIENNTVGVHSTTSGATRQATLSATEAEQALALCRKEAEVLEKKLNAVIKKNRRLIFGNAH